jgi:hypothetical protein
MWRHAQTPRRALRLGMLTLLLGGCSETQTEPMPLPPATPVATVELSLTTLTLELGDSVRLEAQARDADGKPLSGRTVSWSSSSPAVVRVSAEGVAIGLGGGTATITATIEGRSAAAAATVHPWRMADNALVIDSTVLRLLADSAENAAGRFRLRVLRSPPQAVPVGSIVAITQGGGFLRRVTSSAMAGDVLTLTSAPASMSDVFDRGSFAFTIPIAAASGAAPAFGPPTDVVALGEPTLTYVAPGLRQSAFGFDITDVDLCELIKDNTGTTCPAQLKKLMLKNGSIDFNADPDFSGDWNDGGITKFRGVLDGTLSVDATLLFEGEASLSFIDAKAKLFGITRPFVVIVNGWPIIGYYETTVNGAFSVKATARAHLESGFSHVQQIQAGAEYSGSWSPVFSTSGTFTPRLGSLSDTTLLASVTFEAKLSFKPEVRIIFYGVAGPYANFEPYANAKLTLATNNCSFTADAGINTDFGFVITFLDPKIGVYSQARKPWYTVPLTNTECPLGSIDVSTVTSGGDLDPDGYVVFVDHTNRGAIGVNADRSVSNLSYGNHTVSLRGVANNCSIQGGNDRTAAVALGNTPAIEFLVDCTASTGTIDVGTATSGSQPDPDGYTVTIDNAQSQPIGVNDVVSFPGIAAQQHAVALSGIAPNCSVAGLNPITVSVVPNQTTNVYFSLLCGGSQLVVKTTTTGVPVTGGDWSLLLDGAPAGAIGHNDQKEFPVADGTHIVQLDGLPANCQVSGANPQTVQVATNSSLTVTFNVNCQAGGITVSVSTTGDTTVMPTYKVTVDGGSDQTINGRNGSVTFPDLAAGQHTVALSGLPASCVVQGTNPIQVDAPGSTTFLVLCQSVPTCTAPPSGFSGFLMDTTFYSLAGGPRSSTTGQTAVDFGHLESSAKATAPSGERSQHIHTRLEFLDSVFVNPVDPGLIGEWAVLRFHVTGRAEYTKPGSPGGASGGSANAAVRFQDEQWIVASSGSAPNPLPFDIIYNDAVRLGSWEPIAARINTGTSADGSGDVTTFAKLDVVLLGIYDLKGLPFAYRQFCVASGTAY